MDATGPLAQSAERGADITLRLRRGREFEPLTDQKIFFLFLSAESRFISFAFFIN